MSNKQPNQTPTMGEVAPNIVAVDGTPANLIIRSSPLWEPVHSQPSKPVDDLGFVGTRILLVDDNAMNLQIAQELLENAGITVHVANNGLEAVDLLMRVPAPTTGEAEPATSAYDIILMDLQMPEMDGYEATRRIRRIPHYADTPIIAMTAHAMSEEREKVVAAGMNDHVDKPIIPKALFGTLRLWTKHGAQEKDRPALHTPTGKSSFEFPAIPGVNVQEGLARIGGKAEAYARLLKKFPGSQREGLQKIEQSLAAHNLESTRALLHRLKGLAGNLSINDLFRAAVAMEKALREPDWLESARLFNILQASFHAFSLAIEALPDPLDE